MTTSRKAGKGAPVRVAVPVVAPEPKTPVPPAPPVPTVEVGSLAIGESFRLSRSLFQRERTVGDKVLVAEIADSPVGNSVLNRYFIPADTKVVKL